MATRNLVPIDGLFKANRFAAYPDGAIPKALENKTQGNPLKCIINDDSFGIAYQCRIETVGNEKRLVQQQGPVPGLSGGSVDAGQMITDPDLPLFENPRVLAELSWTKNGQTNEPGVFCCAISNGSTWLNFCLYYDVLSDSLRLRSTDFRNASIVWLEQLDLAADPFLPGERVFLELIRLPTIVQGRAWRVNDPVPDWMLTHAVTPDDKPLGKAGLKSISRYTSVVSESTYCWDLTIESATARALATRIEVAPDAHINARRFVDVPLGTLPLRDDSQVQSRVIQEYYPGTGRATYMTLEMIAGDTGSEKAVHVQYKNVTGFVAVMIEAPKARGIKYPRVYAELEWIDVGGGQKRIGVFCNTEDANVNKWNYRLIYDMATQQIRLGLSDDTSSGFSGVVSLDRVLADETRYSFLLERLPALLRGKIWPVGEAEPAEWDVQKNIPLDDRIGGMHGFCHTSTSNGAGGGMAGYCYDLQVSATDARTVTDRELV